MLYGALPELRDIPRDNGQMQYAERIVQPDSKISRLHGQPLCLPVHSWARSAYLRYKPEHLSFVGNHWAHFGGREPVCTVQAQSDTLTCTSLATFFLPAQARAVDKIQRGLIIGMNVQRGLFCSAQTIRKTLHRMLSYLIPVPPFVFLPEVETILENMAGRLPFSCAWVLANAPETLGRM
jgi:hypothetical protein